MADGGQSDGRTRVAVLGGGVGGITAAWELTATPELRDRFEVTVHQLGWRIGGKGASGRNAAHGNRIEEHGLHLWFGFYDNAFRLMRDAYEELGRPKGAPLAGFTDAFKGCDQLVLYDRIGSDWHAHAFDVPRNYLRPGDAAELPTFWEMADTACAWALGRWRTLDAERPDLKPAEPPAHFTPAWFGDLAREVAADLLRLELAGAEHLLQLAHSLARTRARQTDAGHAEQAGHPWFLSRLLGGFRDWLWAHVVAERCEDDPDLRFYFTILDLLASTAIGVVEDGVLDRGWDAINGEEWSDWLRRHGAKELTLGRIPEERSPVLRAVYDVAFGYPEGDISKANVAAGTATNDLMRLVFSFRGHLMYKMQAGMGDTVFSPLYEVLKRRGVRFEFFHAVTNLGLAADAARVDEIEFVQQVEVAGEEYAPLVDVEGLPCWPSEPIWDQLPDGDRLRERGVDFEGEANPLGREPATLRLGVDFDEVVLGIPVGALRPLCGELIEVDELFAKAIETAVTVQTQAFQLWMKKPSADLGWAHSPNSVAGCYVEPMDTYCDMSHLLSRESWGDDGAVESIGYFCGVLGHREGETAEEASERVRTGAVSFLERDLSVLWPGAGSGSEPPFEWDLVADAEERGGPERFGSQYWRANLSGSERYVLTPAGSVEHRLPSDRSGFENLVLAGDWTKNGIDGGCVEAAAISGMQAARSLIGIERPITGEKYGWLQPNATQLPPYVEYGGRATSGGPFLSTGGKLRSFLLEGDKERIADLVDRLLNIPAGPGVDYRAVGSKVLLMIGGFEHVSSMASPFDRWGTVQEIMASFWVPVVAGHDRGDVFEADRLGFALPYVFVDNPMSYLGGRETYGYAKTMARFDPVDGIGEQQRMETFGGNFGRDEGAAWHPFLELTASGPGSDRGGLETIEGVAGLAAHLSSGLLERDGQGEVILPGLRLASSLVDDMLAGRMMRQVFLKQFRDAADGNRACYQSVVEAPVDVKRLVMRRSERDWDLTIHNLDSHPIEHELGVTSQRAQLALVGELDMVVEVGHEVGRIAAPAAGTHANGVAWTERIASVHGLADLISDAARLAHRELSALGRLKWW